MTAWANQKGTQTATVGTEHTLAQNSGANTFQYSADLTNMVNGDVVELRTYRIVNSSAIQESCGIYANVQANPLKKYTFAGSQGVSNGIKVTLKQTAGTSRNFDWELLADSNPASANVTQWLGTAALTPGTAGTPDVNVIGIAGGASNIKKNQQLSNFMFLMTDSTNHAPLTGATVTPTRSIDGAAFASCANSVTEVANGWYKITLANTDLNGNVIALRFTATGADDRDISFVTQP